MKHFRKSYAVGVAALSGLLAVGITPTLVNPAFADPFSGSTSQVDENKPSINIANTVVHIAGKAQNTDEGHVGAGFDKNFANDYKVKVTKTSTVSGCGTYDSLIPYTKQGDGSWGFKVENALSFTPQATNTTTQCTYTIEQVAATGSNPTGWEPSGINYTLKVNVQTVDGTGTSKDVLINIPADGITDNNGQNLLSSVLKFENVFHGSVFHLNHAGAKWNAGDASISKIVPLEAGSGNNFDKLPSSLPAAPQLLPAGKAFKEWNTKNDGTGKALTPGGTVADFGTTFYAIYKDVPVAPAPGGSGSGSAAGSGNGSGGSSSGSGSYGGGYYSPSTSSGDKAKPSPKPTAKPTPKPTQSQPSNFDQQFKTKVTPKVDRAAAGATRVETSLQALSHAKNHDVVVLATGNNFPDALVGGAFAGAMKAGVALTTADTLEPAILARLKAAHTKTVHIVGGENAVSTAKENALRQAGFQVIRHQGSDRYDTARLIKEATRQVLAKSGKSTAAINCNATGSNFPDALACASTASLMGGTVDLVRPGSTVTADQGATKTICAGGAACQAAGKGVNKIIGSDRYETAYKLAELAPKTEAVLVSNGQSYADSLVAGALTSSLNAKLVLSDAKRANLPQGTKTTHLIGGAQALPNNLPMYTK